MERQHLMHVEEIIPLNKQRCKVSLEGNVIKLIILNYKERGKCQMYFCYI